MSPFFVCNSYVGQILHYAAHLSGHLVYGLTESNYDKESWRHNLILREINNIRNTLDKLEKAAHEL